MTNDTFFQIRVTGILIEDRKILLVKQKVNDDRFWSLPGGRMEHGETMGEALIREIKEETGLDSSIIKLLYICEKPDDIQPIIHVTFLLEKTDGELTLPTNEYDENPIRDLKMVSIMDLCKYGFTEKFRDLVLIGFKESGSYMGLKNNIGL